MHFWDTSAIVPMLIDEPRTADVREVVTDDPVVVVWWGTAIECLSAIARREREGGLAASGADGARGVLEALRRAWHEVAPSEEVRERAAQLLLRQPLRAGDSLQLAAALTLARGRPREVGFCALDQRLRDAARREGFRLPLSP